MSAPEPESSPPERVLIVTAHPDDVDFGAAGTVANWTDAGVEVSYCIVTDGDAGGFDRSVPRRVMAEIRRAEQTAAAKEVGVEQLYWLGHADGRVEANLALRRDISRVIRMVRPQIVVTQSPDRNYQRIYASHPDHLAAGEAALSAVYPDARNPFAHTELLDIEELEPWSVPEVWLMALSEPDRYVDITAQVDRKLAALRSHVSQHPDPSRLDGLIRDWGAALATAGGLAEGHLAEAFLVVDTA